MSHDYITRDPARSRIKLLCLFLFLFLFYCCCWCCSKFYFLPLQLWPLPSLWRFRFLSARFIYVMTIWKRKKERRKPTKHMTYYGSTWNSRNWTPDEIYYTPRRWITIEFFVFCPWNWTVIVCPLKMNNNKPKFNWPSIDFVIKTLQFVFGNLQVLCVINQFTSSFNMKLIGFSFSDS